jgi:hypothetical protein
VKIEELRTNFALKAAAGIGTQAPEFRLPDVKGDLVSLTDLLRDCPGCGHLLSEWLVPLLQYPIACLPGCPAADGRSWCAPRGDLATASGAVHFAFRRDRNHCAPASGRLASRNPGSRRDTAAGRMGCDHRYRDGRLPCRERSIRSFRFSKTSNPRGVNHDPLLFPPDAEPRESRALPGGSRPAL